MPVGALLNPCTFDVISVPSPEWPLRARSKLLAGVRRVNALIHGIDRKGASASTKVIHRVDDLWITRRLTRARRGKRKDPAVTDGVFMQPD